MYKPINWDSTKAIKGGEPMSKVPAGGYICKIIHVYDVADKQYLKVELDIMEGEYKGIFSDRYAKFGGNWPCFRICSYKDKAVGMFKGFITSVEESNDHYQFDFNEQTLVNKLVGVLFGEEEFITNDGEVKVNCKPQFFRSVAAIRSGDYEIPQIKRINPTTNNVIPVYKVPKRGTPEDIPYPAVDPFAQSTTDEVPF